MAPRIRLAVLLLAAAASAALSDPGVLSPRFRDAYGAAKTQTGRAFENAEPVDAARLTASLTKVAVGAADQAKLAEFKLALAEQEKLRVPVRAAAAAAPAKPGEKPEILDAEYKAKVAKHAAAIGVSPELSLEMRRRLLAASPATGLASGDVKADLANPHGPQPSPEVDARLRAGGTLAAQRANVVAASGGFADKAGPGSVPGGVAPAAAPGAPGQPSVPPNGAEMRPAQHLKTNEVPLMYMDPMGMGPGLTAQDYKDGWKAFKDGMNHPWTAGKEAFDQYAAGRMAKSDSLEKTGTDLQEKGGVVNNVLAAGAYTGAWFNRLAAANPAEVKQVAVGAAVTAAAVAFVLTLPVSAPVAAGTAVAGTAVAGTAVAASATTLTGAAVVGSAWTAGLTGLTTYGVIEGTGRLAREQNATSVALLGLNAVPAKLIGAPVLARGAERLAAGTVAGAERLAGSSKITAEAFKLVDETALKVLGKPVEHAVAKTAEAGTHLAVDKVGKDILPEHTLAAHGLGEHAVMAVGLPGH